MGEQNNMFAKAIQTASKFTLPVIISKRHYDGNVECGCASFTILNPEGWIITAAHVLEPLFQAKQDKAERDEYDLKCKEINDASGPAKHKRKLVSRLSKNNMWITNHSYWWGKDGVRIEGFKFDKLADLAVGKLEPFAADEIKAYPILRSPSEEIFPGTSLCRLGFPFHQITATFDETTGFKLAEGVLPMPRFPNDGIHTRTCMVLDQKSGRTAKFLETSTPGLRGQSGGPIFDVEGRICGIQSQTMHLPLGFAPPVKDGKTETKEHQFMNVGLGAHVEEVIRFLESNGISFNTSS
jgi:hypothetical protein